MIRSMEPGDLEAVAAIWLAANQEAHAFLPTSYWTSRLAEVKDAMAQAEVWAFADEGRPGILGFIGLQGDYIAGLFVRREARSRGVGRQLLDHVKTGRAELKLQVYVNNPRAEAFYRREGFRCAGEGVDPETGQRERCMAWHRPGGQGEGRADT